MMQSELIFNSQNSCNYYALSLLDYSCTPKGSLTLPIPLVLSNWSAIKYGDHMPCYKWTILVILLLISMINIHVFVSDLLLGMIARHVPSLADTSS